MFTAFFSQTSFFIALLFFGLGAFGSLLLMRQDRLANWWGHVCALFGALFGILATVPVLFYNNPFSYVFSSSLPLLSFSFRLDQLSAFFLLVISLIALLASVYGLGYSRQFYKKYNLGTLGFFYNLFIAGMMMVVSSHHALFFLIVWEIMSLASYFLVIYEHREKVHLKAGALYIVMTHVGTAFITLAFLLLYNATGSFDFGLIKASAATISPAIQAWVFILAFLGFGMKAGIVPLHVWLPSAHPAAPTHVSALMSGVMIKTGIYMLIRICLDFFPHAPLWWGVVILSFGAISSLLGVLYALTEHDVKKLLAYHSIENIGIILLGLGSSLVFMAVDKPSLAILGLVAALFHTLNHAIFKALLFFGAGSVIMQMKTRNMEEYGGLIKYMPQTALFFLIGAMAISALPPLNGFFSEWATFQALFLGIRELAMPVRWVFIVSAGLLACTGGLAAACFVKVFGIIFLARPRSVQVKQAQESTWFLKLPMATLALLTAVLGFFAGFVVSVLWRVATSINIASATISYSFLNPSFGKFSLADGFASVSMPLIFIS
ncbi:MAG: hypothetical protein A2233_04585, partial [Candidatus Kerfeldbacteria bacterium RIFOXYA2_FULL_38_24]